MDDKLDFERAICVCDDHARPQGLREKLQLVWAHGFDLGIRQIKLGTDGNPHRAI